MASKNNIFNVNGSSGSSAIEVDSDGNTVIKNLILLDEKTGNKWSIKVSAGELIIEPAKIEDKREFRINKVLDNG